MKQAQREGAVEEGLPQDKEMPEDAGRTRVGRVALGLFEREPMTAQDFKRWCEGVEAAMARYSRAEMERSSREFDEFIEAHSAKKTDIRVVPTSIRP